MRRLLDRDTPYLVAILGVFAIGWTLVGPGANVPVIDDWVYAWSVEHLVQTRHLEVLPFSAIYPISQILWGALFAKILGFSFAVLRLSTVILSTIGCCALYLTLRELGCRRVTSLLGALALAFDPAYFALSFSFMTEVPFVSISSLAIYGIVRGLRRGSVASMWAGAVCAIAAYLVRPVGLALPMAALLVTLSSGDWRTRLARTTPFALALATMAVLQIGLPRYMGALDWAAVRQSYLQWWFMVPLADYARWTLNLLTVAAFPCAPLLLAYVLTPGRAWRIGIAAAVLAVLCWIGLGELSTPLPDWQTWSLQEITARSLISGELSPSTWSHQVAPYVKIAGLVVLASMVILVLQGLARRERWGSAEVFIVVLALGHIAAIHVLWLYNDRYYIVLAPPIVILAAGALDEYRPARWLVPVLLIAWGYVAITGTRDMLSFNETVAELTHALEASGVAPYDIDAGYSLNGWRLYAHPENLRPGTDRQYGVPYVTSKDLTEYSITNTVPAGADLLRMVQLDRATWQPTHAIYVVRRTPQ